MGARAKLPKTDVLPRDELRELDESLHERLTPATSAEPPVSATHQVVETRRAPSRTLRLELVACGKINCKRCGGKRPEHGPYWYAYWREGKKIRSKYIGKTLAEPGH